MIELGIMDQRDAVCTVCGYQLHDGEECYEDPVAGCVCEECIDYILKQRKCRVSEIIDRI
jgi:hypothetical protein